MPPVGKGRRAKGSRSDLSDMLSDVEMGPPTKTGGHRRSMDGEIDSSGSDFAGVSGRKKYKSDKAIAAAAAVTSAIDTDEAVVAAAAVGTASRNSRPRQREAVNVAEEKMDSTSVIKGLRKIGGRVLDIVLGCKLEANDARKLIDLSGEYEDLIMKLVAENERLRGKLDILVSQQTRPASRPISGARTVAARNKAVVPAVEIKKPVETWSVVVRGKGGAATSKEVVEKVVEQVGPTLGVRVHDLKPIRGGGAVIRTPSVAERDKIRANKKFEECGLEVQINEKLGPRVIVRGVHAKITPNEFMEELYEMNFKNSLSFDVFKKSVRLVSKEWKPDGGPVNLVLEGGEKAMSYLLNTGRVYIKWFSFPVRPQNEVAHCFKCLGFDHRRRDCRMQDAVCRVCSQTGHEAWQCQGQPWCRNCAFNGLPADHSMLSSVCPTYAALIARANARH